MLFPVVCMLLLQDSALDSLVAARHAVLVDLARDPPPGPGPASADFMRRDSAGDGAAGAPRREAALLDPLLQARRLVRHPWKLLPLTIDLQLPRGVSGACVTQMQWALRVFA